MTTKPNPVTEALESIAAGAKNGFASPAIYEIANEALPLAREQAEKAGALDWVVAQGVTEWNLRKPDCPAIIKRMIEDKT